MTRANWKKAACLIGISFIALGLLYIAHLAFSGSPARGGEAPFLNNWYYHLFSIFLIEPEVVSSQDRVGSSFFVASEIEAIRYTLILALLLAVSSIVWSYFLRKVYELKQGRAISVSLSLLVILYGVILFIRMWNL